MGGWGGGDSVIVIFASPFYLGQFLTEKNLLPNDKRATKVGNHVALMIGFTEFHARIQTKHVRK